MSNMSEFFRLVLGYLADFLGTPPISYLTGLFMFTILLRIVWTFISPEKFL